MSNRLKGTICIILSAFFFALMAMFVRLAGDIPSMQKAFFRNFVAMIFSCLVMLKKRQVFYPAERKHWIPLLLRAAFGTVGLLCNFYAVDYLNLSDAAMLNKMSPFFAIIFSFLFLRERLTAVQIISVVVAFSGSLLVIKPDPSNMLLGPSLIGLLGGLGAGAAYTVVRSMSGKGINSSLIVFVFSTFSCLVCLPYLLAVHAPMTPFQLLMLLLAGACGCAGQLGITNAYIFAPAREISVYDYSQVIFSTLLGWAIFNMVPDLFSVVGYVIICGTAVFMFFYHSRRSKYA